MFARMFELQVHADFNMLKTHNLSRRVNTFFFLNEDWRDEWEGHLELWDRDMKRYDCICTCHMSPTFLLIAERAFRSINQQLTFVRVRLNETLKEGNRIY